MTKEVIYGPRINYTLKYLHRPSEFEIQSDLYQALKSICNVRGDCSCFANIHGVQRKMRLDLVVYDNKNEPLLIIEVKRGRTLCGTQKNRYEATGLKVIHCLGPKDIDKTIKYVINNFPQTLLST